MIGLREISMFTGEGTERPWITDGRGYATDRRVLIEFEPVDGMDVGEPAALSSKVREIFGNAVITGEMAPVPFVAVPTCQKCRGRGIEPSGRCPECYGDGMVEWDSAYHTYQAECQTCEGSGIRGEGPCEKCAGKGMDTKSIRVKVGAADIAAKHIAKICQLPNARIMHPAEYTTQPVLFTFDGGRGVVMVLRAHV